MKQIDVPAATGHRPARRDPARVSRVLGAAGLGSALVALTLGVVAPEGPASPGALAIGLGVVAAAVGFAAIALGVAALAERMGESSGSLPPDLAAAGTAAPFGIVLGILTVITAGTLLVAAIVS